MSVFGSFLVLLLILVEAAPPTASSVPVLGMLVSLISVLSVPLMQHRPTITCRFYQKITSSKKGQKGNMDGKFCFGEKGPSMG